MTGTPVTRWHRLMFKLRIYQAHGDQFQDLVNHLYRGTETDFQSIAPHGNLGDGGNDGWIPSTGHYLQVYGPKATTQWKPNDAVKKAVTDFGKLQRNWLDIRQYSFVINDRFCGIPAPVSQAMQTLKCNHCLEETRAVGADDLERRFHDLSDLDREEICGGIPSDMPGFIDPSAVGDLLNHLADRSSPISLLLKGEAPDLDEKIQFNGLCQGIANTLKCFSYQNGLVSNFFDKAPELQQATAEEMRKLYEQSKLIVPDHDPDSASTRYVWMVDQLVPAAMRRHKHTEQAYQDAAQVVIATYFETCDVYEHPPSTYAP